MAEIKQSRITSFKTSLSLQSFFKSVQTSLWTDSSEPIIIIIIIIMIIIIIIIIIVF